MEAAQQFTAALTAARHGGAHDRVAMIGETGEQRGRVEFTKSIDLADEVFGNCRIAINGC